MTYACRACGRNELYEVLDMGRLPLAGDFRLLGEPNQLYPLAIDGCTTCGLLQVRETVAREVLFNPHYSYASSTVPGLVRHFEAYAAEVAPTAQEHSRPRKLLEVGCNDGVFLAPLHRAGFDTVGIDASENVVAMARERGLRVHVGVFDTERAGELLGQHGTFDVVTCSNVFAHNPEVNEFISAVDRVLKPSGEFWVEVQAANRLFEGLQWDCFYHEHCFYWTIHALSTALTRHGFGLQRYTYTTMHGGGLRAVFSKGCKGTGEVQAPAISEHEWRAFGQRCEASRATIRQRITALPVRYAYGAAGRAVILINWTDIAGRLEFVVDGSPLRAGKAIPNTIVPIISESDFFRREDLNEWCFVTAHNYLADIRDKVQTNWPSRRMRFLTPLPDVRIE